MVDRLISPMMIQPHVNPYQVALQSSAVLLEERTAQELFSALVTNRSL